MKNSINKNKLILIFSILSLCSCSDIIDIKNNDAITQDNFYRNETEIKLAINGCYNTLRAPIASEWMLSEIRSDNTFMNNTGTTNAQNIQIYNNDVFEAPTFDIYIEKYWGDTYQSIRSINSLLVGLNTSYNPASGTIDYQSYSFPVTEIVRKRTAGEASFMRAYHYFNLVRLFGGVFLVDKPISNEEALNRSRASEQEIYKLIIADLKNASANCISTTFAATPATDKGKVTSWAAKALLAKVYLTLGQKADALPLLTEIIGQSGNSILTGTGAYANVFSSANELNAEIMFAIRFKSGGLGYGSSLSNLFATNTPAASAQTKLVVPAGARGAFNNPTEEFYNSYSATDIRRDYNIKIYKQQLANPLTWTYWAGKHNGPTTVVNDSELDWPVLRFSDVLLMYCEAEGTANTTTLGYLNQIHTRAGLTPLTLSDINTTASYELAVANERRWEFALENQRWFDLLRFNKTLTTIKAKQVMDNHFSLMTGFYALYETPYTLDQLKAHTANPKFNLLPIPNYEIIVNTTKPIEQNPGY